jgi:hypothetical protein
MKFWLGDMKVRDHLGDLGVDGTIILKQVCGLDLPGSRDELWQHALVNTAMNVKVPERAYNILAS